MNKKTIPALVKKYAEEWRDDMLNADRRQERGERNVPNPLRNHVDKYLSNIFGTMLDTFMGIERSSWDRLTLKPHKDETKLTVVEQLLKKAEPQLFKVATELLATEEFKLTKKELAQLRRAYRDKLVDHLEHRISTLAETRAEEITENELDRYMADDEWVAVLEGRHGAKNVAAAE